MSKLFNRPFFINQLSYYEDFVADNDDAFLEHFWKGYPPDEIDEFCMCSDYCRIGVVTDDGAHITSTITTHQFFDWHDAVLAQRILNNNGTTR